MSQLLLAHCTGSINLVSEDEEGNLRELFNGEKCVKFGLGLGESFEVGAVNEEDDTIYFREVVAPEPTCYSKNM